MANQNAPWIVCKLSGEFLRLNRSDTATRINALAEDIVMLRGQYRCALVIGGGNIVRGGSLSSTLGVSRHAAHYAGMVATLVNGIILQDLLVAAGCKPRLLSAISAPDIADNAAYRSINELDHLEECTPIFAGGIATPYVTTDTAATIRALQLNAKAVIKLTAVDGVYSDDPQKNPHAQRLSTISHTEYLSRRLTIIDEVAVSLARDNNLPILVAHHAEKSPLRMCIKNPNYASSITDKEIVW